MPPINDTEVNALESRGYREGDTVPERGVLKPDGTFGSAVMTSAPAVTQTNLNLKSLDTLLADARSLSSRAQQEIDSRPSSKKTVTPRFEAAQNKSSVLDSTIASMSTAGDAPEVQELRANYTKTISDLDALSARMDANSVALMDGIRKEYDSLINQQQELNRAYEGGTTSEGLVSGRARYAPILQAGIVTNVVQEGIGKIAELQSKKAKLLAEAQEARDNKQFQLLQEKMKAYRDSISEERMLTQNLYENTLKASKEARENLEFEREQEQENAKTLAPSVASILTGDNDQDMQIIQSIATENGLNPNSLLGAVNEYSTSQSKSLPATLQEYEYMIRNGLFTGTPLEYIKARAAAGRAPASPKGRVLSQQEAIAMGLPNLTGVSEEELRSSMVDGRGNVVENPPSWFIEALGEAEQMNPTFEYAKERWNDVRNDPDVAKFLTGSKPSAGDLLSVLSEDDLTGILDE